MKIQKFALGYSSPALGQAWLNPAWQREKRGAFNRIDSLTEVKHAMQTSIFEHVRDGRNSGFSWTVALSAAGKPRFLPACEKKVKKAHFRAGQC